MRGARSGVAKRILDEEPRAVYTHCYGHSINLAASDAIKQTKVMRDAFDMTHEITKLIKYSPRREAVFRDLNKGARCLLEVTHLEYEYCAVADPGGGAPGAQAPP